MKSLLIPQAAFLLTLFCLVLGTIHGQDRSEPGLTESFRWQGRGNWSINAGTVASSTKEVPWVSFIEVYIPEEAFVQHAFLYSAVRFAATDKAGRETAEARPTLKFDGTLYANDDWQRVGYPPVVPGMRTLDGRSTLASYRVDVSGQVRRAIGSDCGCFRFSIQEFDDMERTTETDKLHSGEVLVVIYAHPDEAERLIILHDGYLDTAGQKLAVDFGQTINTETDGFEALMSVGIANSTQTSRVPATRNPITDIAINGRPLSSAAGGADDGFRPRMSGPVGATTYLTVGGVGNTKDNPRLGTILPERGGKLTDDELYDLARGNEGDATPFLPNKSTGLAIRLDKPNPDRMDMAFFLGLNLVTAAAPPAAPEPEPDPLPALVEDQHAVAGYTQAVSWTGQGNWSIDAIGKPSLREGGESSNAAVAAEIPDGATVEHAFLYCVTKNKTAFNLRPSIFLGEHLINAARFESIDPITVTHRTERDIQLFRADVTEDMAAHVSVARSSSGRYEFDIVEIDSPSTSTGLGFRIEGEALVVIYSHPSEQTRSIVLADGQGISRLEVPALFESEQLIDPVVPGFEALLSLGVAGASQSVAAHAATVVIQSDTLVNIQTLTASAGGADDAEDLADQPRGQQITIGGLGDSSDNPSPTDAHGGDPRTDDELYDLAKGGPGGEEPFLTKPFRRVQTSIRNNNSDSIVFFIGLNMTSDQPLMVNTNARLFPPRSLQD